MVAEQVLEGGSSGLGAHRAETELGRFWTAHGKVAVLRTPCVLTECALELGAVKGASRGHKAPFRDPSRPTPRDTMRWRPDSADLAASRQAPPPPSPSAAGPCTAFPAPDDVTWGGDFHELVYVKLSACSPACAHP